MSNSHGSTSGHYAHPTPSGSGGSFQSHQREDVPHRKPTVGTSPRTDYLRQGRHPPASPIPPPSSSSPLISPPATVSPQCAQPPKDKSAMGRHTEVVDVPPGGTRTVASSGHPEAKAHAVSSAATIRVDPTERFEEMAGAKPKRFQSSPHTMEVQTEHRSHSSPPAEGATDIMRTDTFSHPCGSAAEGGGRESSKGKTVAEIHAHEEPTPQRPAVHHLPQKGPAGPHRHPPPDSRELHQDRGPSQTPITCESRSTESTQQAVGKQPKPVSEAATELPKSDSQSELMGVSKRLQSALPSVDMWDPNMDPDQLLEERLSATVIRRHVKVKSSTTAAAKKPQSDSKLKAEKATADPSKDIADIVQHQEMKASKEEAKKESVLHPKSDHPPDVPNGVIQSKTEIPTNSVVEDKVFAPDSVQRTAVTTPEKVPALETSAPKPSDQPASKTKKTSPSRPVETKQVVATVDDSAPPLRKHETLQKACSVEKESCLPPKRESSLVKDRSSSVKSHGPGTKHVSIREPPETVVVVKDADSSAQTTAQSSPVAGDMESPGPSFQNADPDAATAGTWVEGGKGAVSKIEVDRLGNPRNSKSCCFCWCCCCSCSCLSVDNNVRRGKGEKTKKPSKKQKPPTGNFDHFFNGVGESQPTLEDIRMWGESFDKLMKCGAGRKVFREFLQCEYSEENILFWLACEDLKKETNPDIIEEKARSIYENFISILSPREVSLDSRVRDVVNSNMVSPTSNTFDEAQLQIYTLMHRDSYPRFVNSAIYRKLAQLPAPSRKGSMV